MSWTLESQGLEKLNAETRLKAENDVRATLLQGVAGLLLVFGAIATWRQLHISRAQLQHHFESNRAQLDLSRESQITERFTQAIDQLGNETLAVCLGGIYALERVARDSEKDHWAVMEVLTAYVRAETATEGKADQSPATEPPLPKTVFDALERREGGPKPRADVQAALTVLSRRTRHYGHGEDRGLDLRLADLRGAAVEGINLTRASLAATRCDRTNMKRANLERANLLGATMQGASLREACLEGAYLREVQLQGADLWKARLGPAPLQAMELEELRKTATAPPAAGLPTTLWGAHLEKAFLNEADLRRADLRCAHLDEASLIETRLDKADLAAADLRGARGLTPEQLRTADNWELAFYDPKLRAELGLPDDHNEKVHDVLRSAHGSDYIAQLGLDTGATSNVPGEVHPK